MSFNPYPWITGRRETKSPDLPPEAKQLYNSVKGDIMSVDQVPGNVFYKNVQPDTTALVLEAIDEDPDIQGESARINYNSRSLDFVVTFPTFFHGVQSAWLMSVFRKARSNRYFSQAEWDRLHISHYRKFEYFHDQYVHSFKHPEFSVRPEDRPYPTIVVESAWADSYPYLRREMELWLQGSRRKISTVFLFKWTRLPQNQVKCRIEMFGPGDPSPVWVEVYPSPPPDAPRQVFFLDRREILAEAVSDGRNCWNDVVEFPIDSFRELADPVIQAAGYIPAQSNELPLRTTGSQS